MTQRGVRVHGVIGKMSNNVDEFETFTGAGIDQFLASFFEFSLETVSAGIEAASAFMGSPEALSANLQSFEPSIQNDLLFESGDVALVVDGLAGDDVLLGSQVSDALIGGIGNDLLLGGDGGDLLVGDTGDDVFFALTSNVVAAPSGVGTNGNGAPDFGNQLEMVQFDDVVDTVNFDDQLGMVGFNGEPTIVEFENLLDLVEFSDLIDATPLNARPVLFSYSDVASLPGGTAQPLSRSAELLSVSRAFEDYVSALGDQSLSPVDPLASANDVIPFIEGLG